MAEDKVLNAAENEISNENKSERSENEVAVERNQPDVESNAVITSPLKLKRKRMSRNFVWTVLMIVAYIGIIFLGGFVFHFFEKDRDKVNQSNEYDFQVMYSKLTQFKKELSKKPDCISEEALMDFVKEYENLSEKMDAEIGAYTQGISFGDGILLALTTASTIGYGSVTPQTTLGKLFYIFFTLLSVPFTATLAYNIGWLIAYHAKKMPVKLCKTTEDNTRYLVSILFIFIVGGFLYITVPALLLTYVNRSEYSWSLLDSFYFTITTLSTIGFGDLIPEPMINGFIWADILLLLWILAGLSWIASIVILVVQAMKKD